MRSAAFFVALVGAANAETSKAQCKSSLDCSLNGLCSNTTQTCQCDPAWTGSKCETLNIVPGKKASGYRMMNDKVWGNTSSWGGGSWYDDKDKKWYMFGTELADHCGMHTWTTNSQTIRASSTTADGLYQREAVVVPIWSHEVVATRGPNGEYVGYFSYNGNEGSSRPICKSCKDGSTDPKCKKDSISGNAPVGSGLGIENTDPTYMSWSATATGNWSKPVMVLGPKVEMDTNMACVINPNGSVVGMWRDHYPGGHHSTPHLVVASDWKDPSSYKYSKADLLFAHAKGGNPGGVEDMFLWADARGHYHALFHCMGTKDGCCETCTGHAYSDDGLTWHWGGTAATAATSYVDGSNETFGHCERPHLIFDETGTKPVALTNGVKIQGLSNDDQSFTLLRPLAL